MASAIETVGLKEFRAELRRLQDDKEFTKELRQVNKKVADIAADAARGIASGMGGIQSANASAIRGQATQTQARIGVRRSSRNPAANAAFWGAKRRSGWYARSRYRASPAPQFPQWVGNMWDVGVAGQGPYAINDAIANNMDQLLDAFRDGIETLAGKAFDG